MGGVPAQRVKTHVYIDDPAFEPVATNLLLDIGSVRPLTLFEKRVAYTNVFMPRRSRAELLGRSAIHAVACG